jgi:hypothetical protein
MPRPRQRRQPILGPNWETWPIEAKLQWLEQLRALDKPGEQFKRTYRNNYVGFAHDCITWPEGEGLTTYQDEILTELPIRHRVAVRGPHGLGKTCLAAISLICFATTFDGDDWKIPTTASAWRQLSEFFWPEVHKWAMRVKWDKVGRPQFTQYELQTMLLKLTTGRAFAMASSDDELTEGAHADHLLYVFDEAKAIPSGRWDAAEGALMTGDTYALAISTPGEPQGRFYDIHTHKPGYENWWTRHVTVDECIAAGRIKPQDVEQLARQWGENSAVFKNRVLGEFCESSEDCVIPLAWIEAANRRWEERIELLDRNWNWIEGAKQGTWPKWRWRCPRHESFQCSCDNTQPLVSLGVDIARSDLGDKTVIARRQGQTITKLDRYSIADTQPVVGYVSNLLERSEEVYAMVDVIGIGAGPFDQLRERFNRRAVPFNASESTDMKDRSKELEFANKRAAALWNLRELLDPAFGATIALPPCPLLLGDLTAPRRGRMTASGKLTVESKDDIRKRIGRSTDDGDAVVMAFFPRRRMVEQVAVESYSYMEYV